MSQAQYQSIPESDYSLGIDARSAENQILPGFVRDLLNMDIVERRARKRPGYQGYGGNLPLRVISMDYDQTEQQVCFTLDSSVSLESVRSSPIVVYGRSSSFTVGQGPFTTSGSTVEYYSEFSVPLRKQFSPGTGTLVITGDEHGLATTNLFISVLESLDTVSRSYQQIQVDSIAIDETTFDVTIGYTSFDTVDVFVIFAAKDTVTGSSYVHAATGVGTGPQTISIPAVTHALSNFNVVAQLQQDTGTSRLQIYMDSFEIAANGDVTITLNNGTGSPQDYYVILSAAPISNMVTGSVGSTSTGTVVLPGLTSPWALLSIYLEQTPGGVKEQVLPDSIDYDDSTQAAIITFQNDDSSSRNFIVFYEYGSLRSNQLCVSETVTTSGTDARPQLSVWGLDHEELYSSKELREAWVSHLDSYRRSGEQRLISGLGGNLFGAREYSEAATSYAYGQSYPSLVQRTSAARVLGPAFWDTTDIPARSRGYITGSASALHTAEVTAGEWDNSLSLTKYTISVPSLAILDSTGTPTTIGAVISTTSGLEDWLTITGMSFSRYNGTFRIRQVTSAPDVVTCWVENDGVDSSDWDDSGCSGQAGVFTDQFTWTANSTMIPGDILQSDALTSDIHSTVQSSSGTTTVADGINTLLDVAAGVLFTASRTSSVIPLRSRYPGPVDSVLNLVRGDMISYINSSSDWDGRELRILGINSDSDRSVTITVSSGLATATLGSGDTSHLTPGRSILLVQAGSYTGVQVVSEILSSTQFSFETTEPTPGTGTLKGATIQVDEELTWEDTSGDTNSFRVERRWIPIEAPDDSFDLTPSTYVRHLDYNPYSDQPFLRSTMVQDTLYLTNGWDEVLKYDGSNLYRSGILPWQPGAFLTQDTSGATIVTSLRSVAYSARTAATGTLTITAALSNVLPVGTDVRLSGSTQTYQVASYTDDGTAFYLRLDRALDSGVSATGTASEIGTYRYYYRLNAVDANNNIVASAVTGYQDHVVELTGNAAILHKLVGFPAWDNYDYDRLELQIYRTELNQAAPFYLITTLALDFDNTQGYLTYRDSFADSDIASTSNLDTVNTALKGTELGLQWSDPLRARFVTSIGNRLIQANLRDYPQLDLQISAPASISNSDFAGDSLLFRRDGQDTGTTTSMPDRVRYEWVSGTTGTASAHAIGTNQFSFTTASATGAVPGDWIYLTYDTVATSGRDLTYSGWWQIAACSTTTVTINLVGAAAASSYPNKYVIATDPTDIPVLLGTDGNLGMVNGDSFDLFDSMRRMSMAINASMRMVDTSLTGMSGFTPWIVSRGGNDVGTAGRLLVRQPRADALTLELVPTFSGYSLFANSVRRSSGDSIGPLTRLYPSRLLISYENYSEIFDNPNAILDSDSDSAIDINPADGQEITGVIPFFGESAFGAAQQSGILVVFKTSSIYLVDINQKGLGLNAVQRIETQGLGCTAPYSIAPTRGGIMFANESGMYCLRRDQSIQYLGRYMERNWTERIDLDQLELVQGHHYSTGRSYKLSIPVSGTAASNGYIQPSEVYVYNHTGEDEGRQGAWGRYDAHDAIGWSNIASDAFWASTRGRVLSVRNAGTETDFRDDNSAINAVLQLRPTDFGNAGIRKIINSLVVHYRTSADSVGTEVAYSLDMEAEYTPCTSAILRPGQNTGSGIDDRVTKDILPIIHNLDRRRGIYISIQISNATLDEAPEIAGVNYSVAGLSDRGIKSAADTE